VPTTSGGFSPANPIKFCLKYDPPIIAIVYQFVQKAKKYVHEIRVDMKENTDINKLCDELCLRESIYLNPQKISKQQIKDLLKKMQNQIIKEKKENIKNDKVSDYK
jgi:hypothetical protein